MASTFSWKPRISHASGKSTDSRKKWIQLNIFSPYSGISFQFKEIYSGRRCDLETSLFRNNTFSSQANIEISCNLKYIDLPTYLRKRKREDDIINYLYFYGQSVFISLYTVRSLLPDTEAV